MTFPEAFLARLPRHIQAAQHTVGSNRKSLRHYVCCPTCHSIYKKEECIVVGDSGELESFKCVHIVFPNHPQLHHRSKCNTLLMKKVKLSYGKTSFLPTLVYCYKSVIESFQEMVSSKKW